MCVYVYLLFLLINPSKRKRDSKYPLHRRQLLLFVHSVIFTLDPDPLFVKISSLIILLFTSTSTSRTIRSGML